MKRGDLVRGKSPNGLAPVPPRSGFSYTPIRGILIEEIHEARANVWWRVLCEDGSLTEETEDWMEVICGGE